MAGAVVRAVLGVCGACALVGGAVLLWMIWLYFGENRYAPELEIGQFGIVALMLGAGLYVAGALQIPVVGRVLVGLMVAGAASVVLVLFAAAVSLVGDPGGERGTLNDCAAGFLCVPAGAYLVWRAVAGRWPATRRSTGPRF
ncbi:hypothetical protein [Actinocatenispora rupis]|uniref:Uncharacterized protein n=1 Tax=Actinocatenispora rupis TaxID=519421 RepID=A0A8J3NCH7_9ACTN|nr:hypothetical protein [Actinocatenispora rupis]GID11915.1 hypothetical protein Aru02nite_28040 [Actinocatenispora rupis]